MKRRIIGKLLELKALDGRMPPVLLCGAKQVGKTYAIREFAALCGKNLVSISFMEFQNVVRCEFNERERLQKLNAEGDFNADLPADVKARILISVLKKLQEFHGAAINKDYDLIFWDDLHLFTEAFLYFNVLSEAGYEIIGAYDGCPSGFSEEVKRELTRGRIHMETVYPMDFEEFLWAEDKIPLADEISEHFDLMKPMPESIHEECGREYEKYLLAGGMPTAVCAHLYHKNPRKEQEYKELLVDSYISGLTERLSSPSAVKAKDAYLSVAEQLTKENRKFQYRYIKSGGRASFYAEIIGLLEGAGLVYKSRRRIEGQAEDRCFKLYMNDTGLLASRLNLTGENLNHAGKSEAQRALYENGTALHLAVKGRGLTYWVSGGIAEIDFFIKSVDGHIPVELDVAGSRKTKSLAVYCEKFKPVYGIKLSKDNFRVEDGCRNIPFYACFKL